MVKTITLKFAGKCRDCGTTLTVGEKARWYGRGVVYGIGCHADNRFGSPDELGIRWDNRRGVAVRANGMCEDAPCCGCCGPNAG